MTTDETYNPPPLGCTCFHCGETFTTPGTARDHFGAAPMAQPGCMVKVSHGGERGLLMALRKAEETIARHMEEDTDLHRALHRMQSQHSDALRDAYEAGYECGLRDGRADRVLWQTMATAPKDGTTVLVLLQGSNIPYPVLWFSSMEKWYLTWYFTPISDGDTPRYWMPLPDDPDEKKS